MRRKFIYITNNAVTAISETQEDRFSYYVSMGLVKFDKVSLFFYALFSTFRDKIMPHYDKYTLIFSLHTQKLHQLR